MNRLIHITRALHTVPVYFQNLLVITSLLRLGAATISDLWIRFEAEQSDLFAIFNVLPFAQLLDHHRIEDHLQGLRV